MSSNERQIHLRLTEEEYSELMKKKEAMGFKTYSSVIRMFISLKKNENPTVTH